MCQHRALSKKIQLVMQQMPLRFLGLTCCLRLLGTMLDARGEGFAVVEDIASKRQNLVRLRDIIDRTSDCDEAVGWKAVIDPAQLERRCERYWATRYAVSGIMGTTPETALKIPNSARGAAIMWWILGVLFFGGIFSAFFLELAGIEAGDWQFAAGFFCLIASPTSLIMAVIYTKRSNIVKRIQLKEGLLAHWSYTAEEWEQYTRKEHTENKREKREEHMMDKESKGFRTLREQHK